MTTADDLYDLFRGWRGDPGELAAEVDPAAILIALVNRGRPSWHSEGACYASTLDFVSKGGRTIAACLQVCGGCVVREQCRAWADEIGDTAAVLGGEDPSARKARWRVRGINQTKTRSTDAQS